MMAIFFSFFQFIISLFKRYYTLTISLTPIYSPLLESQNIPPCSPLLTIVQWSGQVRSHNRAMTKLVLLLGLCLLATTVTAFWGELDII